MHIGPPMLRTIVHVMLWLKRKNGLVSFQQKLMPSTRPANLPVMDIGQLLGHWSL
jgi:hypothetical protein